MYAISTYNSSGAGQPLTADIIAWGGVGILARETCGLRRQVPVRRVVNKMSCACGLRRKGIISLPPPRPRVPY